MVICDLLRIAVRFITLLPLAIGGMLTKKLTVMYFNEEVKDRH